jgi:hypothetical protein
MVTMKTVTCPKCLKPFSYEPTVLFGREVFAPAECPVCVTVRHLAAEKVGQQEEIDRRFDAWNRICPTIFHDTDLTRIPHEIQSIAESWESEGGHGLGLVGLTGRCKTRAAYLILRRYHFDGLRVKPMNATRFGQLCLEKFSDDHQTRGNAIQELHDLKTAKLILLDDVAKERITERVASELFGLINDRTEWKRPILWTSNIDPAGLRRALGDDKGNPLVRRLREFTRIVEL